MWSHGKVYDGRRKGKRRIINKIRLMSWGEEFQTLRSWLCSWTFVATPVGRTGRSNKLTASEVRWLFSTPRNWSLAASCDDCTVQDWIQQRDEVQSTKGALTRSAIVFLYAVITYQQPTVCFSIAFWFRKTCRFWTVSNAIERCIGRLLHFCREESYDYPAELHTQQKHHSEWLSLEISNFVQSR